MKKLILTFGLLVGLLQAQVITFEDGIHRVSYDIDSVWYNSYSEPITHVEIYLSLGVGFSYIYTPTNVLFINYRSLRVYDRFEYGNHCSYDFRYHIYNECGEDYWGPFVYDCSYMQDWPPFNQVSTICPKRKKVKVITILIDK